ncbi:sodium:proton exchanger [archaeon CG10_big_fil_rev_8_21_14_0_10_43_11]|nr:MAG: sodium:proton exchanger [archaeon CG10_big_fil_rev_8_21_14_0_10_43_11]
MIEHSIILIVGVVLLVKGSDAFVESATRLAKKLGISDFVIGVTLVAIGTSLPELVATLTAALNGYAGLAFGNVIGSNIANIGLILGLTTLFLVLKTNRVVLERDGYALLAISVVFYAFVIDGGLSQIEGVILITCFFAYMAFLLSIRHRPHEYEFSDFVAHITSRGIITRITRSAAQFLVQKRVWSFSFAHSFSKSVFKDLAIVAVSLAAVLVGANAFVNSAAWIANMLMISQTIIGASIVALGTSLPELSVSFSAARKGLGNLVVGNVIGSNITNISLVIGSAALFGALPISFMSLWFFIPTMLLLTIVMLFFVKTGKKLSKQEGIVLLFMYVLFLYALSIIQIL